MLTEGRLLALRIDECLRARLRAPNCNTGFSKRFVQYSDPEIYASHFDLDVICQATPPYNVAPSQPVVAIRQTREGKRELVPYCWILYAVSNVVNSPRNDGPELIESVEASHA